MKSMELDEFVKKCLALPGASEETPFGPDALVYKVAGKMFALVGEEDGVGRVNLKGDPDKNVTLREDFKAIIPGYHMNKRHWNTVVFDGSLPRELVEEMLRESYDLVVVSLPKKLRQELE